MRLFERTTPAAAAIGLLLLAVALLMLALAAPVECGSIGARSARHRRAASSVASEAGSGVDTNWDSSQLPELGLPAIRIGSFNIQVFGVTKMTKPHVVSVLLRTLERYDLVFIMEIRDITGQAIKSLLLQLNNRVGAQDRYSMAISDRLGRTSSKEQYAFFYRDSIFDLVSTYQYEDPQDLFERPPYGALFNVHGAHGVTQFGVLGLHTSPRDAFSELEALHSVQRKAKQVWQNENLLVVGDFNADCSYMSRQEKSQLQLVRDGSLTWLITACMETTTVKTKCIYDHILATGTGLTLAVDTESAEVFRFDREFQLNSTVAEEVSDHYPVELLVTGEMHKPARKLIPGQSLEVTQPLDASGLAALPRLQALEGAPPSASTGGFRTAGLLSGRGDGQLAVATATRDAPEDAGQAVADFRAAFPGVLTAQTAALVAELVARRPLAESAPLPGYSDAKRAVRLTVACSVAEMQCTVRLAAGYAACTSRQ